MPNHRHLMTAENKLAQDLARNDGFTWDELVPGSKDYYREHAARLIARYPEPRRLDWGMVRFWVAIIIGIIAFWLVMAYGFVEVAHASTGTETLTDARVKTYEEVAQDFWKVRGRTACNGHTPELGFVIDTQGTTESGAPSTYLETAAAWSDTGGDPHCIIWINDLFWDDYDYMTQCEIIVHEWGHLTGLGHSDPVTDEFYDPNAVPYPVMTGTPNLVRPKECKDGRGTKAQPVKSNRTSPIHLRYMRSSHMGRKHRSCRRLRQRSRRVRCNASHKHANGSLVR